MKKIFTLFLVIIISIIPACSFDEPSKQEVLTERVSETSVVETIERTAETEDEFETTQAATMPRTSVQKIKKLDLGEIDEWSFNSRSKFIYFTDYGRYYPVETSGLSDEDFENVCNDLARHSAIYDLCIDNGSEKTILDDTGNCVPYYCDGSSIYIYKYDDYDNHKNDGIYKLYKEDLIKLIDYPDNGYISAVCFTEDHIYYSIFIFAENKWAVYRTDYNGNNVEHIFDNPTEIWDMTVYNEKIWFECSFDVYQRGLACFDMKTSAISKLKDHHIGYINNDYMYYSQRKALYRINLSDFKYEKIVETDNHLISFDFYKDYILYSSGNSLYKMNDNENTLIFSTEKSFENEDYQIREIQCQDNRIFLKIGSGAFYQCIMEIDIDGNVIEVIHED